ncbi:hypothetical protein IP88_08370 [alpha proteobacterium AAP81b]|nr:hypothetical protein IP88_08370 [alpha proteobacterium AAP81b]
MRLERVRFAGDYGQLSGRIDWPAEPPRGLAVFAHCFSCGKDIRAAARIARALAAAGVAVLRFDFTGLGESEGEFAGGFSGDVADVVAAAAYLRGRASAPLFLIGHSLGGAAVLAAAAGLDVAGVVALAAPASAAHVLDQFAGSLAEIEASGSAEVRLAGRPFRISQRFVDDVRDADVAGRLAALTVPVLLLYAPDDRVVAPAETLRIFENLGGARSIVAVEGADHLFSAPAAADQAAALIAAWMAPRLAPAATSAAALPDAGVVTLFETGAGTFQQRVHAGGVTFLADEPEAVGGLGTGPSPYDLLAAALGACTAMTLRLYARRKGLELAPLVTRVRHAKIHAADCAECETKVGKVDALDVELEIAGDLSDEQRARLVEIADMCPVHRTLQSDVRMTVAARQAG